MDGWIVIPNWEKFQHYTDRNPAWVKLYTELNRRDDWRSLTLSERGVLVSIWAEYGSSNGQIRVVDVGHRIGLQSKYAHLYRHIESLNRAGFVTIVASKPLALARSREKKVSETEKNYPKRIAGTAKPEAPRPAAEGSELIVERLIRNGVISDLVDLNAELAGYRINGNAADRLREGSYEPSSMATPPREHPATHQDPATQQRSRTATPTRRALAHPCIMHTNQTKEHTIMERQPNPPPNRPTPSRPPNPTQTPTMSDPEDLNTIAQMIELRHRLHPRPRRNRRRRQPSQDERRARATNRARARRDGRERTRRTQRRMRSITFTIGDAALVVIAVFVILAYFNGWG